MNTPVSAATEVDLDITGMTCASCAARVEKKLNRMPGVIATVNYGTDRAHIALPKGTSIDDAIATIEATGYRAQRPRVESDRERALRRARTPRPTPSRDDQCDFDRSGGCSRDDPATAVRLLAMVQPGPCGACRCLGRSALPPGSVDEPAPRRGDHGHLGFARRRRGLRVVAVCAFSRGSRRSRNAHGLPRAALPRRRQQRDLFGGRCGCHHLHPARSVFRNSRQEQKQPGSYRAVVPWRQGRHSGE